MRGRGVAGRYNSFAESECFRKESMFRNVISCLLLFHCQGFALQNVTRHVVVGVGLDH